MIVCQGAIILGILEERICEKSSPVQHVVVGLKVEVILFLSPYFLLNEVLLELLRILDNESHVRVRETDEVTQVDPVMKLGVKAMAVL